MQTHKKLFHLISFLLFVLYRCDVFFSLTLGMNIFSASELTLLLNSAQLVVDALCVFFFLLRWMFAELMFGFSLISRKPSTSRHNVVRTEGKSASTRLLNQ